MKKRCHEFLLRIISLFSLGGPVYAEPENFIKLRYDVKSLLHVAPDQVGTALDLVGDPTLLSEEKFVSLLEHKLANPDSCFPQPYIIIEDGRAQSPPFLKVHPPVSLMPTAQFIAFQKTHFFARIVFFQAETAQFLKQFESINYDVDKLGYHLRKDPNWARILEKAVIYGGGIFLGVVVGYFSWLTLQN